MGKPISNIAVTMRHGQAYHNIARNGTPKKLTAPAPTHGMKRQTADTHAYLHGQSVNDETLENNWSGKQVPVHPGMGSKSPANRGKDADGFAILEEAGRLARPKA